MSRVCAILLGVLLTGTPALAFEGRIVDAEGHPLANATVSILGRPGEAITDADGRFEWQPDPSPPFEILVIQASGTYMKPAIVRALGAGLVTIAVAALVSEALTVSGSAPGIDSTPGSGATTLSGFDVAVRQPGNVVQALENVAGVSQVSEGHAAVPAIRGLARGRTVILIDGARVTSERRVGPSATYLDPATIEGVDVVRGPGSVAYGSDAFGGVISVRTRRVTPGAPWGIQLTGTAGVGVPEGRVAAEVSKGFAQGGVLLSAHTRQADDWSSPQGEVFNSGYRDRGFLGRVEQRVGSGTLNVGWQSDFGRDIERPRNNSQTVRFSYPYEDSHIRGFEVEAQTELPRGFSLDVATEITEGRALDDNAYLDDIPPVTLTTVLRKSFGTGAYGQLRLAWFSDDENKGPTERVVAGYTLLDLAGSVTLAKPLQLRISARNLLNDEYYASQDTRTVLAPGRSASMTVVVSF